MQESQAQEEQSPLSPSSEQLTDKQLFTLLWTSPARAFAYVEAVKHEKYLYTLLALAGIGKALEQATIQNMGERIPWYGIVPIAIIVGPVMAVLWFNLYALMLAWTGKWFKGKADSAALLRVLAVSLVPIVIGLVFLIPQVMIHGEQVFIIDHGLEGRGLIGDLVVGTGQFLNLALGLWSLWLTLVGVSEVQGFSKVKAFLNLLLPLVMVMMVLTFIAFILGDLFAPQ